MGLDLFVVVSLGGLSELGPGKGSSMVDSSSCAEWRTFVLFFNEEMGLDMFDSLESRKWRWLTR